MYIQLLREGCIKFMLVFVNLLDVNPFVKAFTLSQAVLKVYRKNFMREHTLGVVPLNNYHSRQNRSFIGDKWLINENTTCGGDIKYEQILQPSGISVDGYNDKTNTVYEFMVSQSKQNYFCYCFMYKNRKTGKKIFVFYFFRDAIFMDIHVKTNLLLKKFTTIGSINMVKENHFITNYQQQRQKYIA